MVVGGVHVEQLRIMFLVCMVIIIIMCSTITSASGDSPLICASYSVPSVIVSGVEIISLWLDCVTTFVPCWLATPNVC